MTNAPTWQPCSGLETLAGVVWLPRLLQKARRCEVLGQGRLFEGYCFGDKDFIDAKVLRFLRIDDGAVSALVRENPSDADVARIIVERSGRTAEEIAAFSTSLRKSLADFVLLEADEGRMPGVRGALIKFAYNALLMPVIYMLFRRDERKREAATH